MRRQDLSKGRDGSNEEDESDELAVKGKEREDGKIHVGKEAFLDSGTDQQPQVRRRPVISSTKGKATINH